MSSNERRVAPRKDFKIPLRFRVVTSADAADTHEGETLNLSERGVYFTTNLKPSVGEPVEMFFTLPRELTGRSPEPVRCQARIIHVCPGATLNGRTGVGVAVERFEPEGPSYKWGN